MTERNATTASKVMKLYFKPYKPEPSHICEVCNKSYSVQVRVVDYLPATLIATGLVCSERTIKQQDLRAVVVRARNLASELCEEKYHLVCFILRTTTRAAAGKGSGHFMAYRKESSDFTAQTSTWARYDSLSGPGKWARGGNKGDSLAGKLIQAGLTEEDILKEPGSLEAMFFRRQLAQ